MSRTFSGKQKHRTSLRQTSVLSMQNIRTFAQRSPMFCNFLTPLFCIFPTAIPLPPQKKFLENLLHFLHHTTNHPVFTDDFG